MAVYFSLQIDQIVSKSALSDNEAQDMCFAAV